MRSGQAGPDSHTVFDAERDSYSVGHVVSDSVVEAFGDAERDAVFDSVVDAYGDSVTFGNSLDHADALGYTHAYRNANSFDGSDFKRDTDTGGISYAHSHPHDYAQYNSDALGYSAADVHADTHVHAHPHVHAHAHFHPSSSALGSDWAQGVCRGR